MNAPTEIKTPAPRGRPKTRFADHGEQVRQNMQLYRRVGRESCEILKKTA